MPVTIPNHKIYYTPVPKVACSSIKSWFFQLENGRPFQNSTRNGMPFHIHTYYSTAPFHRMPPERAKNFWKFAVVRDPVARLISCYSNRVIFYNELSANKIPHEKVKAGATPNPSLEEFVEKLEIYMDASKSIEHHASPHVFFLGDDASYYDRIFTMKELGTLEAELKARTGTDVGLPHKQTGGPKIDSMTLSANAVEKIERVYARDYEVFSSLQSTSD